MSASLPASPRLPPGGAPDYQLGGAYEPAPGVQVVGRDRSAGPAPGRYSICYVNGFQTQPGELELWDEDLLLTLRGELVTDPNWPGEVLLDTSTEEKRARILATVTPWVRECAAGGFEAVELDNLDSYSRSHGALDAEDNIALAAAYVDLAHEAGLAAGQKNAVELSQQLRRRAGFDFALVEECAAWRECAEAGRVYGAAVIDVEYSDNLPRGWPAVCADPDTPSSVVLRDRGLTGPDDPRHVLEHC